MILDLEESFIVGQEAFFYSGSHVSSLGVTFEDDLTTGYFYAVDKEVRMQVLDALHIYNVADITDKHIPCLIQMVWTDDGLVAFLLINHYCHAIFDFDNKAGYCRNAFPESSGKWSVIKDRQLTDNLVQAFEHQ